MEVSEKQKTVVVGAGPVGALAALYAARRGDVVEVYELRGDLRDPSTTPLNFTKSINLALSERGINSMKEARCPGLIESVLAETIPMYGRMIHGQKNGSLLEESQKYDVRGRYIRAVDRAGLNKRLLDELEKMSNVTFFFNHKLVGADFKSQKAWFEQRSSPPIGLAQNQTQSDSLPATKEIEITFDFLIGCDGAHSAVRYHLMKFTRMSYQQTYVDTMWCEFHITPKINSRGEEEFAINENHLHIWPAGTHMFIAIPSLDKSFTSTLFLDANRFADLDANPNGLVDFFEQNFPGVVPDLISPIELRRQYLENPHLPLISIKCSPYHYGSSGAILGDAAHAMVPFYGQGMNAGFEDVRVLYEYLDKYMKPTELIENSSVKANERRTAREKALEEYSRDRKVDAHSINDLALQNYQEMRHDVTSPLYLARKTIEEKLYEYFPSLGWATQYSRVSFSNDRYSEVETRAQRQGKTLLYTAVVGLSGLAGCAGWWIWRWNRMAGSIRGLTKLGTTVGSKLEQFGRRFT